jgi:hypothetical protein
MKIKKDIKAEILFRAEKLMYYNELLIRQCNSWISEEEGNENMMRDYKTKTRTSSRFLGLTRWIQRAIRNS